MSLAHNMQRPAPGDRGYNWRNRGRRCTHCHISEAHADTNTCPVLLRRQDHQLAQVTTDIMSTVVINAGLE